MDIIKKYAQSTCAAFAVKASSLCKVSYIVGSYCAWFSATSVIAPLAGAFVGVSGSLIVFALRVLMHAVVFKTVTLSFLAFCIPGYCASLYWATRSSLVRVGIPAFCIILFCAHPVGVQAFTYSFYWLIPVALFLGRRNGLFFEALGSTFVAHAVGSVIWLYTVPTTASLWLGLIPLVAFERLFFALGMVVLYQGVMFAKNTISKTITQKNFVFVSVQK